MTKKMATGEAGELLRAAISLVTSWNSVAVQGRIARAVGITIAEADVRALYQLGLLGGAVQPSTLADDLQISRPTMSKVLTRLHAEGLIERSQLDHDRRATAVGLTEKGEEAYTRLAEAGATMVRHATATLERETVRSLTGVLDELALAMHLE